MNDPDDSQPPRTDVLRQALARVAEAPSKPSLTNILFPLLPDIEAALRAGATLDEIRLSLIEQGLSASPGAFRGALYRARKRSAKRPPASAKPAPTKSPPLGAQETKADRDKRMREIIPDDEPPKLFKRLINKRNQEK